MPRNRKRKTNIGQHTADEMRAALLKISEGQKIKAVAKLTNIPYTTLYRYNQKLKKSKSDDPINTERLTPNYSVRQIFTDEQERNLVRYIITCSKMFYGLTLEDTRKLAYEIATVNNITVPQKWHDTKMAGHEWLYSFRKRYPELSLRTPEGCSLSRSTSFNRHNVNLFFNNLSNVMSREEAFGNGTRVYNLDETKTPTVQKSARVLANKGQKQVSKVTSAERGTLVTTCYTVNALGNALPPVMIFPRVHFKSHMINGAPAGTLGLATQNGWMNSETFIKTMQHYINYTNSSKDNPSLLIFDNHESHICIEALNLAKDNGVTILTLPPHSTGKLQPLDVGVFGPFKVAYNKAIDSWMMRNPGKTFSIYDVAGCVTEAHMKTMTPSNICNAFKATGIFPLNSEIFTDDDFAPSNVTDRQPEKENEIPRQRSQECDLTQSTDYEDRDRTRTPSPSVLLPPDNVPPRIDLLTMSSHRFSNDLVLPAIVDNAEESLSLESRNVSVKLTHVTAIPRLSELAFQVFEQYTPPPLRTEPPKKRSLESVENTPSTSKAQLPKKITQMPVDHTPSTSRKIIKPPKQFTSPFEFRGLPKAGPRKREKTQRRKGKSMIATDTPNKNEIEQRTEEKKKRKQRKKSAKAAKRKVLESDTEEEDRMSVYSEEEPMLEEEDEIIHVNPLHFRPLQTNPMEGNFILVEFEARDKKIYYIAKVIGLKNQDIEVSFLRKSIKNPNKFHVPNVPDIAVVTLNDIKMILPPPGFSGSTKRTQGLYHFDVDFANIDLR